MGGASLAFKRRAADPYFRELYFVGFGLDIGAGGDPLGACMDRGDHAFPNARGIMDWNYETHGDAQELTPDKVNGNVFDFIHASHVLEHVRDPGIAVRAWLRVLKPNGHLVIVVPDFTMYERRIWPPHVNTDHKTFWEMTDDGWHVPECWTPARLGERVYGLADMVRAQWLNLGWREDLPATQDQTVIPGVECAIEMVFQRLPNEDITHIKAGPVGIDYHVHISQKLLDASPRLGEPHSTRAINSEI